MGVLYHPPTPLDQPGGRYLPPARPRGMLMGMARPLDLAFVSSHVELWLRPAIERLANAAEEIAQSMKLSDGAGHPPVIVAGVQPEYLSKDDAARFLGVEVGTIEQLIRTKQLRYVQIGSQRGRVVAINDLREFAKSHTELTGQELRSKRRRS